MMEFDFPNIIDHASPGTGDTEVLTSDWQIGNVIIVRNKVLTGLLKIQIG